MKPKKPITIRVNPAAKRWLDDYSRKTGITRGVIFENALEAYKKSLRSNPFKRNK